MKRELDLSQISLDKGDVIMGIGKGRAVFISAEGKAQEVGRRELPDFAYLMFPLVARVVPSEFESMGNFSDILALEDRLGEMFGSAEEVYEKVGPALARKGVRALRLAKSFLEMSPVKTMYDTGNISPDTYGNCAITLAKIITKYYPGSTQINKKLSRLPRKVAMDTGKHRGRDGISF